MGDKDLSRIQPPMRAEDMTNRLPDGKFAVGNRVKTGGKPASARRFAQLCRIHSHRMLEVLLEIATNNEHPRQFDAARFVIERGQGKAPEFINVNANVQTDNTWTALLVQARQDLAAADSPTVVDAEFKE